MADDTSITVPYIWFIHYTVGIPTQKLETCGFWLAGVCALSTEILNTPPIVQIHSSYMINLLNNFTVNPSSTK